jgi:hypothetical protein
MHIIPNLAISYTPLHKYQIEVESQFVKHIDTSKTDQPKQIHQHIDTSKTDHTPTYRPTYTHTPVSIKLQVERQFSNYFKRHPCLQSKSKFTVIF